MYWAIPIVFLTACPVLAVCGVTLLSYRRRTGGLVLLVLAVPSGFLGLFALLVAADQ